MADSAPQNNAPVDNQSDLPAPSTQTIIEDNKVITTPSRSTKPDTVSAPVDPNPIDELWTNGGQQALMRTVIGGAAGLLPALVLFKRRGIRIAATSFGAGTGFGMSVDELNTNMRKLHMFNNSDPKTFLSQFASKIDLNKLYHQARSFVNSQFNKPKDEGPQQPAR